MVWSLALCPDDAKQDPVEYGAEFVVVFLAEGPRTACIQEGLDCLGLYHSDVEGEQYFRLVVELTWIARLLRLALSSAVYAVGAYMWSLSSSPTRLTRRLGKLLR